MSDSQAVEVVPGGEELGRAHLSIVGSNRIEIKESSSIARDPAHVTIHQVHIPSGLCTKGTNPWQFYSSFSYNDTYTYPRLCNMENQFGTVAKFWYRRPLGNKIKHIAGIFLLRHSLHNGGDEAPPFLDRDLYNPKPGKRHVHFTERDHVRGLHLWCSRLYSQWQGLHPTH